MKPLSHDLLTTLLDYDPETGFFTWRVYRNQYARPGTRAGYVHPKNGYRYINIGHKLYLAHRLAFFYMEKTWPEGDVDHIHGDRDDNRWAFLRKLYRRGNMENLHGAHVDNKSGFLGVVPCRNRFAAQIRMNGKNTYLGTFDTAEEAHQKYLEVKREAHEGCTL